MWRRFLAWCSTPTARCSDQEKQVELIPGRPRGKVDSTQGIGLNSYSGARMRERSRAQAEVTDLGLGSASLMPLVLP